MICLKHLSLFVSPARQVNDFYGDDLGAFAQSSAYEQPDYTYNAHDYNTSNTSNQHNANNNSNSQVNETRILDSNNTDNFQAPSDDDFSFMSQEERDAQTAAYLQFQEDSLGGNGQGGKKQRGGGGANKGKKDCVIQ